MVKIGMNYTQALPSYDCPGWLGVKKKGKLLTFCTQAISGMKLMTLTVLWTTIVKKGTQFFRKTWSKYVFTVTVSGVQWQHWRTLHQPQSPSPHYHWICCTLSPCLSFLLAAYRCVYRGMSEYNFVLRLLTLWLLIWVCNSICTYWPVHYTSATGASRSI